MKFTTRLLVLLLLATPVLVSAASYTQNLAPGDTLVVQHPADCRATPGTTQDTYACPAATPTPTATMEPPVLADGVTCADWVHARYTTTGADGKTYPTWHPQRDPVYGCYFHHEHGSDPALFPGGYKPAYGYVNAAVGMPEAHQGFKSFLFDDSQNRRGLITLHLGTGNNTRQCARFHAVNVVVAEKTSGALLGDVAFMGDFGPSYINATVQPTQPDACPAQFSAAQADGSKGSRMLPSVPTGSRGYEPWTLDTAKLVLGLSTGNFDANTMSTMASCATNACSSMVYGDNADHLPSGALRFLTFSELCLRDPNGLGTFSTDMRGRAIGGPVHAYIKPGLNACADPVAGGSNPEEYWPLDAIRMFYRKSANPVWQGEAPFNLDNQLRIPN